MAKKPKSDARARVLAAEVNKLFKDDRASSGSALQTYPNDNETGTYPCTVRGLEVNWEDEFTYRVGEVEHKLPAISTQFHFTHVQEDGTDLEFSDKRRVIVLEPSKLPENKSKGGKLQTTQRINRQELKGSLTGLLGDDPGTIVAGLDAAVKMFAEAEKKNTEIEASVYCCTRKRKGSDYTDQFCVIQELLGAVEDFDEEEEEEEDLTEGDDEVEEAEEEGDDEEEEIEEEEEGEDEEEEEEEEEEPAPKKPTKKAGKKKKTRR